MKNYGSIEEGIVLRPSENDFRDFRKYIEKIITDKRVLKAGAVKIISPASFRKESLLKQGEVPQITVTNPIEQQVFRGNNLYQLQLVTKKSMPMTDYKNMVDLDEKLLPNLSKRSISEIEKFVK